MKSVEETHWNLLDWFVVVIFIFVCRGGLLLQITCTNREMVQFYIFLIKKKKITLTSITDYMNLYSYF